MTERPDRLATRAEGPATEQTTRRSVVHAGRPTAALTNRRSVLHAAGLVGVAGVASACTSFSLGSGEDEQGDGSTGTTLSTSESARADIAFLQTAASLAQYAVVLYDTSIAAAESGALRLDSEIRDALGVFRADHQAHGDAFNASAIAAGGESYAEPNAAAMSAAAPDIAAITDGTSNQSTAVPLLHTAELLLADTYFVTGTASLSTPRLRQSALLSAQVDRLHATAFSILAIDLGLEALPVNGFAGGNEAPSTFYV